MAAGGRCAPRARPITWSGWPVELDRPPRVVAEVGCGDGVLLELMAARGLGESHHGYEISEKAVAIATERLGPGAVERFDGEHLPVADRAYDLGVLSHVLEHVPDPMPLLRETARASPCRGGGGPARGQPRPRRGPRPSAGARRSATCTAGAAATST